MTKSKETLMAGAALAGLLAGSGAAIPSLWSSSNRSLLESIVPHRNGAPLLSRAPTLRRNKLSEVEVCINGLRQKVPRAIMGDLTQVQLLPGKS
jgi:hypothetical protein